jgi:hypothetical protein
MSSTQDVEQRDRGGVSAKTEIEVTAKPYETVFEAMESGSRAAYRAGTDEQPHALVDHQRELPAVDDQPIDAQTIDSDGLSAGGLIDYGQPITPDERESGSPFDTAPPASPGVPPLDGLMTLEAATSAAAEIRREALSRRAQRALPRGST